MENKNARYALGIIAATLHTIAYGLYMYQTYSGQSGPKVASWSIWAFLAILNAFNYKKISDLPSALQFFAGSVMCSLTFFFALFIGRFEWPSNLEWIVLSLGAAASVVWWEYQNAKVGHYLIVIAFLISFEPTLMGVIQNSNIEAPLPWIIWTIAFAITMCNVWLKEKSVLVIGMLMPVVLLFAHGAIAVLSK